MKPRVRKDQDEEYKLKIILSKCIENDKCLEWTGNYFINKKTKQKTYPYIYFKGKAWRGNRLVLFLKTKQINSKFWSLHKCDNKKCLNPNHLYWGSPKDNIRDAYERKLSFNSKMTTCKYGHPYNERLRYIIPSNGKTYCRACSWFRSRKIPIEKEVPECLK